MRFAVRDGRTVLVEARTCAPLYLSDRLTPDGPIPSYALLASGGGLLGSERLHTSAVLEDGAQVQLGAVGATRLLPAASACAHEICLTLCSRAQLRYVAEPLIPCVGARYRQRTTVTSTADATLLLAEIITPGRMAAGERYAYHSVDLRCDVYRAGTLVLRDRLVLDPASGHLAVALGPWTHLASVLVLGPCATPDLVTTLQAGASAELAVGASVPCTGIVVVRALGRSAFALTAFVKRAADVLGSLS